MSTTFTGKFCGSGPASRLLVLLPVVATALALLWAQPAHAGTTPSFRWLFPPPMGNGPVSAVSFSGASQVYGDTTTWTVGFTPSSTGALVGGNTVTATFDPAFIGQFTQLPPTVSFGGDFSGCGGTNPTVTVSDNEVTATLPRGCSLAALAPGSISIAGITNPEAATYFASGFLVSTSADTTAASADADVTIALRPLALAGAVAQDKVYDGATAATVDFSPASLQGVVNGDDVSFDSADYFAGFSTKDAGTHAVAVDGVVLMGTKAHNYSLTEPFTLRAAIAPKPLTVTADDKLRAAGQPAPTFTVHYSAFADDEDSSVLSGTLAFVFEGTNGTVYGPSETPPTAPGTYSITPEGLSSSNYTISFAAGTYTIAAKRSQKITFVQPTSPATYGSTFHVDPTADSGLPVALAASGGCSAAAQAIGYLVTMTSGATACELTASQPGNGTYDAAVSVKRTVVAAPKSLTVTADDQTKVEGDPDPEFTVSYSGFVSGDDESVLGGSLAFSFTGKDGTVYGPSDTPPSAAGTYAITPKGLTSGDYDIGFQDGTYTITPEPPDTVIDKHPPEVSDLPTGDFTFHATLAGSTFACRVLDDTDNSKSTDWHACSSPDLNDGLLDGHQYTWEARASKDGQTDPTPATYTWTVVLPPYLVRSDPRDGTTLTQVKSLTLVADRPVSWTDVHVVRQSDGAVTQLASSSARTASLTRAFQADVPSLYTILATIDDGHEGGKITVASHFTIPVAGEPASTATTALAGSTGSLDASDGGLEFSWPAAAIRQRSLVQITPSEPDAPSGAWADYVSAGLSYDSTIHALENDGTTGASVHSFAQALQLDLVADSDQAIPLTREGPSRDWRAIPLIPSGGRTLPPGQTDGYYRTPGRVHVLTLHLSRFKLVKRASSVPLRLKVNASRRLPAGKRAMWVRAWLSTRSTVVLKLTDRRGVAVAAQTWALQNGFSYLHFVFPARISRAGRYRLTAFATSYRHHRSSRSSIRVYRRPACVRHPSRRGSVVVIAPNARKIAARVHRPLQTKVLSASKSDTIFALASRQGSLRGLIVDVDQVGVPFIGHFHSVYPDVKIVGLTEQLSHAVRIKQAGASAVLSALVDPRVVSRVLDELLTRGGHCHRRR